MTTCTCFLAICLLFGGAVAEPTTVTVAVDSQHTDHSHDGKYPNHKPGSRLLSVKKSRDADWERDAQLLLKIRRLEKLAESKTQKLERLSESVLQTRRLQRLGQCTYCTGCKGNGVVQEVYEPPPAFLGRGVVQTVRSLVCTKPANQGTGRCKPNATEHVTKWHRPCPQGDDCPQLIRAEIEEHDAWIASTAEELRMIEEQLTDLRKQREERRDLEKQIRREEYFRRQDERIVKRRSERSANWEKIEQQRATQFLKTLREILARLRQEQGILAMRILKRLNKESRVILGKDKHDKRILRRAEIGKTIQRIKIQEILLYGRVSTTK